MDVPKLKPPSDFEERVIRFMRRVARPILIGEVSLEYGFPLVTCEWQLELLRDKGVVMLASQEYMKSKGYHKLVVCYCLVQ